MNKRIGIIITLSIVLVVVGIAIPVLAANEADNTIPTRINYQGFLTDNVGNPIDGPVTVEFRLYNVSSGGSHLWNESHALTADQGIVNAELGKTTAITTAMLAGERWLGVTIAGDSEMTPRKKLGSTPYAYYADEANNANTLDGLDSDDFSPVGIKFIGGYCGTFVADDWHKYCMSTVEHNTAAGYFTVAADGTFTATKSGYYRVNVTAQGKATNSCRNLRLVVNAFTVHERYLCDMPSSQYHPFGLDVIWPVNAGETFYVEYFSGLGSGGPAFYGDNRYERLEVIYEGPL